MHTNQKLFVDELIFRGASVEVLDTAKELIKVVYKNKLEYVYDRTTSMVCASAGLITSDKYLTKKILEDNGINTPQGRVFNSYGYMDALAYASDKYPVVLKPNYGSHGDDIVVDICNECELILAIDSFYEKYKESVSFIIEKFYAWPEYRFFVTKNKEFAVIHREWAYVVGDGVSSINELVLDENNRRAHLKKTINTSLCPIVLDAESERVLYKNGLTYNSIIQKNKKIYLRYQSNLAKGGVSIDVTDQISVDLCKIAFRVLDCIPNLLLAGIDILCKDIKSNEVLVGPEVNYTVLEINSNPGFAMHHLPCNGISRNVAAMACNVLF